MTLRQLELFLAVVETGSFSRAAEAVALTQSTVSQHLAALEEEYCAPLLDRTRKGVFPTPAGAVLLQHARRVLSERDVLNQAMAALHGLKRATLNLGASNIPANHLIPDFLPLLQQDYPGITLNLSSGDSREVLAELKNAQVELAIVGGHLDDRMFSSEPLLKDQLVLIVGPNHPFQKRSAVAIEDLLAESFIVREEGSGSYQALQKGLAAGGLDTNQLPIIARLGSNEAVRRTVAGGLGCAFVSDLSIQDNLKHGELYKVAVAGLTIERQLWLVKLFERTPSPAALAVSDLLRRLYSAA